MTPWKSFLSTNKIHHRGSRRAVNQVTSDGDHFAALVQRGVQDGICHRTSCSARRVIMERMPIACAHCAKAKAKCDKKIPCTRCVGKQINCQLRATRRSSNHPGRRTNISKGLAERNIRAATAFQISKPSRPQHKLSIVSRGDGLLSPRPGTKHRTAQMIPAAVPIPIAPASSGSETCTNFCQPSIGGTTQNFCLAVAPFTANIPFHPSFWPYSSVDFDPDAALQYGDSTNTWGDELPNLSPGTASFDLCPPAATWSALNATVSGNGYGLVNPQLSQGLVPEPLGYQKELVQDSDVWPNPETINEPDAMLFPQHSWPFHRCIRLGRAWASSPKTAYTYVESLINTLQERNAWPDWPLSGPKQMEPSMLKWPITTMPLSNWSREKLLAITQDILHRELNVHKAVQSPRSDQPRSSSSYHQRIVTLPPLSVVQRFLQHFVGRYEPYYPSVPGGGLDPNVLIEGPDSEAAALLILLMIAAVTAAVPAQEARIVGNELAEDCRVSLFDYIEKDVLHAKDTLILRSALFFTCLAAWSGGEWHMDLVMEQRVQYLTLLTQSGFLESSSSYLGRGNSEMDPGKAREEWKENEERHRVAHSWIVVDQEMSLFSDTAPLLSTIELHMPIPHLNRPWQAKNAADWLVMYEYVYSSAYPCPPSMREMFSSFAEGKLSTEQLSPVQMRLLLHPLHAQIIQLRQFMNNLPTTFGKCSARSAFSNCNALLEKWYDMTRASGFSADGQCWATVANMIMYHLVSLNTVSSFRCIERFVRQDVDVDASMMTSWLHMQCGEDPTKVNFHCGQILRLLRAMPGPVRPPWWAVAVYRVALTLLASSMLIDTIEGEGDLTQVAIDGLPAEDEKMENYLKHKRGLPVLMGFDAKSTLALTPSNVLLYCAKLLNQEPTMRLTEDTIWRKLNDLMSKWA